MLLTDAHTHAIPSDPGRIAMVDLIPGEKPEKKAGDLYFSCGIHPDDCDRFTQDELKNTLRSVPCSALGECGLDPRSPVSPARQEEIFLAQIRLSEELKLPLVIHCVRQYYDLIRIRKSTAASMPWLIHGFRGKPEIGKALLNAGCLLSLSPVWLLHQAVFPDWLPRESFLLESDEKPELLKPVYEHAAALLGESLETLCRLQQNTFRTLIRAGLTSGPVPE